MSDYGSQPWLKDSSYQQYVLDIIPQANYCQRDRDCYLVPSRCPYGCCVYVNRDEQGMVAYLMEKDAKPPCQHKCERCPTSVCRENKCVPSTQKFKKFRIIS